MKSIYKTWLDIAVIVLTEVDIFY